MIVIHTKYLKWLSVFKNRKLYIYKILIYFFGNSGKNTQEPVIPKTPLDYNAIEMVEYGNEVKPRHSAVFITNREFNHFLKYELSEDLCGADTYLR